MDVDQATLLRVQYVLYCNAQTVTVNNCKYYSQHFCHKNIL